MNYFSDKNKRTAIIGTLLFHVLVILVLVFTGLTPPMPPRPEIGVEVNLGNSDQGMGEKQTEISREDPATPPPTPQTVDNPDKVVTQDNDQTIAVPDKPKTDVQKQTKVEPKEEPKPIDKRFVFDKNKNSKQGGSEGDDTKPGDKGKVGGDPNATNYVGSHGNGVSFSLKGRKGRSLPKPNESYTGEGTVLVKIWVNKSGKVINAVVQEKGTNTSDSRKRELAIKAAKSALFDSKPDAPETQVGTIEYVFEVN
jgi:TonB family protein